MNCQQKNRSRLFAFLVQGLLVVLLFGPLVLQGNVFPRKGSLDTQWGFRRYCHNGNNPRTFYYDGTTSTWNANEDHYLDSDDTLYYYYGLLSDVGFTITHGGVVRGSVYDFLHSRFYSGVQVAPRADSVLKYGFAQGLYCTIGEYDAYFENVYDSGVGVNHYDETFYVDVFLSEVSEHSEGILICHTFGNKYEFDRRRSREFNVDVRLRVGTNGSSNDTVISVELGTGGVWCNQGSDEIYYLDEPYVLDEEYSDQQEDIDETFYITKSQASPTQYTTVTLETEQSFKASNLYVIIEWFDQVDCYLDWIRVYDDEYNALILNPDPSSVFYDIKENAIDNYDSINVWGYFGDEPYPNPFNNTVTIPFEIFPGINGDVSLIVYNVLGRLVADLRPAVKAAMKGQRTGYYEVIWDGKDPSGIEVGSGVYIVVLHISVHRQLQKVVLLR